MSNIWCFLTVDGVYEYMIKCNIQTMNFLKFLLNLQNNINYLLVVLDSFHTDLQISVVSTSATQGCQETFLGKITSNFHYKDQIEYV